MIHLNRHHEADLLRTPPLPSLHKFRWAKAHCNLWTWGPALHKITGCIIHYDSKWKQERTMTHWNFQNFPSTLQKWQAFPPRNKKLETPSFQVCRSDTGWRAHKVEPVTEQPFMHSPPQLQVNLKIYTGKEETRNKTNSVMGATAATMLFWSARSIRSTNGEETHLVPSLSVSHVIRNRTQQRL